MHLFFILFCSLLFGFPVHSVKLRKDRPYDFKYKILKKIDIDKHFDIFNINFL